MRLVVFLAVALTVHSLLVVSLLDDDTISEMKMLGDGHDSPVQGNNDTSVDSADKIAETHAAAVVGKARSSLRVAFEKAEQRLEKLSKKKELLLTAFEDAREEMQERLAAQLEAKRTFNKTANALKDLDDQIALKQDQIKAAKKGETDEKKDREEKKDGEEEEVENPKEEEFVVDDFNTNFDDSNSSTASFQKKIIRNNTENNSDDTNSSVNSPSRSNSAPKEEALWHPKYVSKDLQLNAVTTAEKFHKAVKEMAQRAKIHHQNEHLPGNVDTVVGVKVDRQNQNDVYKLLIDRVKQMHKTINTPENFDHMLARIKRKLFPTSTYSAETTAEMAKESSSAYSPETAAENVREATELAIELKVAVQKGVIKFNTLQQVANQALAVVKAASSGTGTPNLTNSSAKVSELEEKAFYLQEHYLKVKDKADFNTYYDKISRRLPGEPAE